MTATQLDRFYDATFLWNGRLLGLEPRGLAELPPSWVRWSKEVLQEYDGSPTFRVSADEPFADLEVELTASGGLGYGKYYMSGEFAAAAVYLRNNDVPEEWAHVEPSGLLMCVDFLRFELACFDGAVEEPFGELLAITERPLHIYVSRSLPEFPEPYDSAVREVAASFAGAYLLWYSG